MIKTQKLCRAVGHNPIQLILAILATTVTVLQHHCIYMYMPAKVTLVAYLAFACELDLHDLSILHFSASVSTCISLNKGLFNAVKTVSSTQYNTNLLVSEQRILTLFAKAHVIQQQQWMGRVTTKRHSSIALIDEHSFNTTIGSTQ
jgi:hypothetical protein